MCFRHLSSQMRTFAPAAYVPAARQALPLTRKRGAGGGGERLHDSEHPFTCQRDGTREEKEWAVFLSPSIEDPGAFSQSLRDLINLHSFYITHSLITYL